MAVGVVAAALGPIHRCAGGPATSENWMSVYMFLGCLVGRGLRNLDEPSVASALILVTTRT